MDQGKPDQTLSPMAHGSCSAGWPVSMVADEGLTLILLPADWLRSLSKKHDVSQINFSVGLGGGPIWT